MSNTMTRGREFRKLSELAREYAQQGYQVFADLPTYPRPERIENIIPDLVAVKDDQVIIVEVKTSDSLQNNEAVVKLAEYARERPGVRFDLVLTNPRPQSSTQRRLQALQEELHVLQNGLLTELEYATKHEMYSLAVIIASRLLESLLVRAAFKREIELPSNYESPVNLANYLCTKNVISQSVKDFIVDVHRLRNRVVHGTNLISNEHVSGLHEKVSTLLEEW